jgi:hypothetical protein
MLKRLLLSLVLLFPTTAWADDVTPTPTPSSSLEWDQTPLPGSESWGQPPRTLETVYHISGGAYSPPAEASQGVGGWAVVHPGTGVVHGVIVATIDTYYANNGRMHLEYMGCPAGCLLRFQTRATADGNVAGWAGPEITFDNSDATFNLGYSNTDATGTTTTRQKLIPALTALDGVNIHTGLINIRTEFISSRINDLEIKLTKIQDRFDSLAVSEIAISNWKTFNYTSDDEVVTNLDADLDAALVADGYELENPDEGGFVETVKSLTGAVKRFFGGVFNRD